MKSYSESYKAAGVDVTAGYESVRLMKEHVARTNTPGCISGIGGFGGLFMPDLTGMKEPVLVSGTDGVGTKLKLAMLMDKHDTIGIDAVAMCVNDIICCGAKPLFFLDYIACGKNIPEKVADIVSGVAEGAPPGAQDAKGIAFGLAAAVLYAATVIINKKIEVEDAYEKTIVQLLSAAAVLIPYLLLTEDFSTVVLDARTVVLVLIVGIVHSGLAYALYFGNVNKLPAQSVAVLSYIDPVSSLFFSALLLHERLTAFGLLGAVLIFGSALVSELGGKKLAM